MSEEIRPRSSTVKVGGTQDTSVTFTDVETGEEIVVGYITPGMIEKVKLEKNHWYTVEAVGDITLKPIEVRVR